MKTKIINALLFVAGYIALTIALSPVAFFWGNTPMWWTEIRQEGTGFTIAYCAAIGLLLPLVFASIFGHIGVLLIKQSFVPGLDAKIALKAGETVQIVDTYGDNIVVVRRFPFGEKSQILQVRFPSMPQVKGGWKYIFDGRDKLDSVTSTA